MCHYSDLSPIILNVIMLSLVSLSGCMLSVVIINVVIQSVIILLLSVIMLYNYAQHHNTLGCLNAECHYKCCYSEYHDTERHYAVLLCITQ